MHPDLMTNVEAKVDELITARLIQEVQYPVWSANIVYVKTRMDKSRSALTSDTLVKLAPMMIFQSSMDLLYRCHDWLRDVILHGRIFRV